MLKLARNALANIGYFVDQDNNEVRWKYIQELHNLQQENGMKMANKLSKNHIQFYKHKMNVRLASQTLSSSVANAIEFMDIVMKDRKFEHSNGTVSFIREIDRLFDILNSRNPM